MSATCGNAAHHAESRDAASCRGIDDGLKNLADGRFAYFRHDPMLPLTGNFVSPLD